MTLTLCDRFPALTPFDVRKQKGSEVFLLMRRLSNMAGYKNNKKKSTLRRPAGDAWF